MPDTGHIPVLADQILSVLAPEPGQVCLDCTVGRGGHAAMIVPRLAPGGRFVGLDLDPANVHFASQRLADAPVSVDVSRANFADARGVLDELGICRVDLLLADLGCASNQLDEPGRGFSFSSDGPLDMRLNTGQARTAADLVNRLPQAELADLIYQNGEERLSRKIARKIVEFRHRTPIQTTGQLAQIVRNAYGGARRTRRPKGPARRRHSIDPATRTFMALRIAVNAELEALDRLLAVLCSLVRPGGAAAVVSFHSLEDRRVKQAFAALRRDGLTQWLTRKPLVADEVERAENPRSRSAKLRAVRLASADVQARDPPTATQ